MEDISPNQNNNQRRPLSLTITAAIFTSVTAICYILFITGYFFHIGYYHEHVIAVATLTFPALSITTMVLAVKCKREKIRPFWIPNLILCVFFVVASFPTSCALVVADMAIVNEENQRMRKDQLREKAKEIATIEYMKHHLSDETFERYDEAVIDYFVSMEFTLVDSQPYSGSYDKVFYRTGYRSESEYGVYFAEDYSSAKVYCIKSSHGLFVGRVSAEVETFYTCNPEEGATLFEIIKDTAHNKDNSYSSMNLSAVFYL